MPRCAVGLALCGAIDEVRESVALWAGMAQVTSGRPQKQLDHVRRQLEEHDASCWSCSQTTKDA